MTPIRRWTEPIDSIHAEHEFARFVRQITRQLREPSADRSKEVTTLVTLPNRPPRKANEHTTSIKADTRELALEEVRKRRLLGQNELDASLDIHERKRLIVELTALYRHGHMDDVIAEIEKVCSKYPNDVQLLGTLGDFFLDRGDLPRAIEHLFQMTSVHLERADAEAAKRCLERVRVLEPENKRLKKFEGLLRC